MKRLFTISGIFTLLLFSQNTFAQEVQSELTMTYKGDNIKKILKNAQLF